MPELEQLQLREGAVALTDALGFRAAARRPNGSRALVDAISAARSAILQETTLNNLAGEVHIHYAAISDTIVLAASTRGTLAIADVVGSVAASVVAQVAAAARANVPLAYRGCLSVGSLAIVEDDLYLGNAIDEAAQWYEQALAAIVWLTPEARAAVEGKLDDFATLFVEYELPIRDVGTVEVLAVNPFYFIAQTQLYYDSETPFNSSALDRWTEKFLAPLRSSNAIDVVLKRQNTERFLSEASRLTIERIGAWVRRKHEQLPILAGMPRSAVPEDAT